MKKFFAKILGYLHMKFANLDSWINEHVQPAVNALQLIKSCVDSKACDVVTALIPGTLDDVAADWIRKNIGKAIDKMKLAGDIGKEKDFAKKIELLITFLKDKSPEEAKGYYIRLASLAAQSSGNVKTIKGHDVDLLVQVQATKTIEGIHASDIPGGTGVQPKYFNAITQEFE